MFRFGASILCASAILAGCSSAPVAKSSTQSAAVATAVPKSAPAPATSDVPAPVALSSVTSATLPQHLDPKSSISKERSVYFDFDVFAVKSEYSGLIDRHGRYLQAKPVLSIKIEGHADERGSAEYNLALGQKRAHAVLQALKIYGVKDGQMEAVSWGSERPKTTGHDEAAWAEDRRADLVYPKQ
ncbi:MAG: peptidoglycan-associated lipoprotein Pal [Ramlibacter sp.]|nr:peptidoglycan-associated lipoprotein Pal [Ramlibacter sp.]